MREKFIGVGAALITPFNEDHTVDYASLEKLIEHILSGGTDYLCVNGTTGEGSTIDTNEKNELLEFIGKLVNGRVPIMYGIGANNTMHVLQTIKNTDFTYIDSILSVAPYYNKPTQDGHIAHYQAIADKCPVPVVMYNIPGRTGVNMTATTTLKLAKHKNILGIKEASGDIVQCMTIAKNKPEDFLLISGDDMLTLPMISFGGDGVISVLANAFPINFNKMVNDALNKNFEDAYHGLFDDFLDLNDLLYKEGNPVGIKEVLSLLKICKNTVRLPLLPASSILSAEIQLELEKLSIPTLAE